MSWRKIFVAVWVLVCGLSSPVFAQKTRLGEISNSHRTIVSLLEAAGCVSTTPLIKQAVKATGIKISQVTRLRTGTVIYLPSGVSCGKIVAAVALKNRAEIVALRDSLTVSTKQLAEVQKDKIRSDEKVKALDSELAQAKSKSSDRLAYSLFSLFGFIVGVGATRDWYRRHMYMVPKKITVRHKGEGHTFHANGTTIGSLEGTVTAVPSFGCPHCDASIRGKEPKLRSHLETCSGLSSTIKINIDPKLKIDEIKIAA